MAANQATSPAAPATDPELTSFRAVQVGVLGPWSAAG
jgi:hypothetical protein